MSTVHATLPLPDVDPEGLLGSVRIRTPAGGLLLSLTREEIADLTVGCLRKKVTCIVGRCTDDIKLLVQTKELQPWESVAELLAQGEEPLEVLALMSPMAKLDPNKPVEEQFHIFQAMLDSCSPEHQFEGSRLLRKILCREENPLIDAVVKAGLVPRLVELAGSADGSDEMRFEALWALRNVSSGTSEHCMAVIDGGIFPVLSMCLQSANDDIFEHAAGIAGNVAGDGAPTRDTAIGEGVGTSICASLDARDKTAKFATLGTAVWALSNFFRGTPKPSRESSEQLLGTIALMLRSCSDQEVMEHCCWSLSFASEGGQAEDIDLVLRHDVTQRLVELVSRDDSIVCASALRALSHLASGEHTQTQVVLDSGVLAALPRCLDHQRAPVRKVACSLLSNICAGSSDQVQAVIVAGLMPALVDRCVDDLDLDVRKKATSAIAHASGKSPRFFIESGAMARLVSLLSQEECSDLKEAGWTLASNCLVPDDSASDSGDGWAVLVRAALEMGGAPAALEECESASAQALLRKLYTSNE